LFHTMIKIRVPFKFGRFLFEKDVDFLFRIATLESASLDILKCELWEIESQNSESIHVAILYSAYCLACEKKRRRKYFQIDHAKYWVEHMSKSSREVFIKSVQELIGKMNKVSEKKKKR
jgi:hypothetical protein